MGSSFNELPREILERILGYLPRGRDSKFCDLRLISKRLDIIVGAIIFAKISYSAFGRDPRDTEDDLVRMTTVLQNVKNLCFMTTKSQVFLGDPAPWPGIVDAFTQNTVNLTNLEWFHTLDGDYGPKSIEKVTHSLSSLPNLRELSLRLDSFASAELQVMQGKQPDISFELHLEPISNLRSLAIEWNMDRRPPPNILAQISGVLTRSPGLEELKIVIPHAYHLGEHYGPQVTFGEIFDATSSLPTSMKLISLETRAVVVDGSTFRRHLRHFRHLSALRIRHDPSPSAGQNIGEVFQVLASERIELRNVHIDVIHHPNVFDYLSSYSGIQELSLKPGHPLDDSSALIRRCFELVLPAQSSSLTSLRIGGNLRTQWSRVNTEEYLAAVAECKLLKYLCCWIWVTYAEAESRNSAVVDPWLEVVLRLPNLQRFNCPPVVLKKRSFARYEVIEEPPPGERDPDPDVRYFLEKAVFDFKWGKQMQCRVDARYREKSCVLLV
ncbi:hypothetical protein D9756_010238 [Leucocoprinus leucothites]|uniref:F-box domain-containing protein n=1 Tax=Leucocoprinus leucothites TaxID=201217 RepID=A0A8H5CTT0_9AGAR|nr:hypothetical protein D9756_010238 [Leucoagaricus leucothites]